MPQDVTSWLSKLRLDLQPDEHTAPLLSNPLRNGLLLAGIAAAVTSQPLPGIHQPVNTLAAARSNLLVAAARLGLLSSGFAAAAAAAVLERDRFEALAASSSASAPHHQHHPYGLRGHGALRARSSSPGRLMAVGGAAGCSPVRIQRAPSSSGSNNCCYGGGGSGTSPLKQLRGRSHSRSRSRSPNPCSYKGSSCGGGGCAGLTLDDVERCGCFAAVATGPGVSPATSAHWEPAGRLLHEQGAGDSSVLSSPASSCCCDCWACAHLQGTVLEHGVLELLEMCVAGDTSCMWGLLYALQQVFPVVPAAAGKPQPGSPTKQQQLKAQGDGVSARKPGAASTRGVHGVSGSAGNKHSLRPDRGSASGPGAAGASSSSQHNSNSGCITVQPLQGPSWRSFQLPYNAAELAE